MSIEKVFIGNIANDGTGDDLRVAFDKVNRGFEVIENQIIKKTGENLGDSGEPIFAGEQDNKLEFRRLVAGKNINFGGNNNSLVINSEGSITSLMFITDTGSLVIDGSKPIYIQGKDGSGGIDVDCSTDDLLSIGLSNSKIVEKDLTPQLSGNLRANSNNIIDAGFIRASDFRGNLSGRIDDVLTSDITQFFKNNWNFGEFTPNISSFIDYLFYTTNINFGTFTQPAEFSIDNGSF